MNCIDDQESGAPTHLQALFHSGEQISHSIQLPILEVALASTTHFQNSLWVFLILTQIKPPKNAEGIIS